ncbi:MAG: hypothetical protein V4708_17560 [Bacteroidota bacterium]
MVDKRKIMTPERTMRMVKMREAKAQKAQERKDQLTSNLKMSSQPQSDSEVENDTPENGADMYEEVKAPTKKKSVKSNTSQPNQFQVPKKKKKQIRIEESDDDDDEEYEIPKSRKGLVRELSEVKRMVKSLSSEHNEKRKEQKWRLRKEGLISEISSRLAMPAPDPVPPMNYDGYETVRSKSKVGDTSDSAGFRIWL